MLGSLSQWLTQPLLLSSISTESGSGDPDDNTIIKWQYSTMYDNTIQCMIIQYNVWPLQVRKNWLDTRTLCCVHWHWDNFLTNIKCLLGKVKCLRFWDCLECWCGPPDVFTLVLINMLKVLQISGRVSNSVTSLGSHSPRHKTTGSHHHPHHPHNIGTRHP